MFTYPAQLLIQQWIHVDGSTCKWTRFQRSEVAMECNGSWVDQKPEAVVQQAGGDGKIGARVGDAEPTREFGLDL